VLFAIPEVAGQTGDVYLYADPTGVIRYSDWSHGIETNLHDALPVESDSPIGINHLQGNSR